MHRFYANTASLQRDLGACRFWVPCGGMLESWIPKGSCICCVDTVEQISRNKVDGLHANSMCNSLKRNQTEPLKTAIYIPIHNEQRFQSLIPFLMFFFQKFSVSGL